MRKRIVTLAVLTATLAVIVFGFPLAFAGVQYAQIYRVVALERIAEEAVLRVQGPLSWDEEVTSDDLADDDRLTFLSVYDENGTYLRGRGPEEADYFVQSTVNHSSTRSGLEDGEIVVTQAVTHDGDLVGVVRIAGSTTALLWPVAAAWAAMAGLALVAIGAVWLLARRQGAKLARPLEDMAVAARRLGDGDFSVRLPPVRIPEIDQASGALNRTAVRLDDLLARERAFSAEASHQLRTPLTSLRLGLESALERPGADLRPAIGKALDAAERIEQTIDELLSLARDTHRTTEAMNVGRLVREVSEPYSARLGAEGRELAVVVDPETPAALASAAAVRQVLTVLLDNALSHGDGRVEVHTRDAGDAVAIEVSDAGEGVSIPPGELFKRRSDRAAGHGLGLALAKRLAEAEGGHLRLAQPTPPRFALLLPAGRH